LSGFPPVVELLRLAENPAEVCSRFLDLAYVLFLDSAAPDHPDAHYSFLTADPACVVRSKGEVTELWQRSSGKWARVPGDALSVARSLLPADPVDPVEGLPPFQGGLAGYIGYDWGAVLERLPRPRFDDLRIPDVVLCLYDWVIAWDHRSKRAWLVSTGLPEVGQSRDRHARARMDLVRTRLEGQPAGSLPEQFLPGGGPTLMRHSSPSPEPAPTYPAGGIESADRLGLRSTFTRRGYLDAVARVRQYILAGDIFQANISQRFQTAWGSTPYDLYRRLRRRNPAPFAAYLGFNDVAVLSASPERFLRLDGRQVETRPIKGTRPRGLGPMHDAALGRALAESGKDRAENVMIVDLLRNDLSRVCRPGTVRVPELFAVEHHPTVHHLVSTVVGEIEPGAGAVELIRAAFPGGSITGAPKVRAMEIIAELEPTQRAVYCGSIGYLSATGSMDTSIVIRTYLLRNGQVYFQAGGGIVADSDPDLEYRETLDKARGLIETLAEGHEP
jgi:para-aminobenzoate synthetase component 1